MNGVGHTYHLGVDLGTTYTAAAVWRRGRGDMATLGNRAEAMPSVVFHREDDVLLFGEAAELRADSEPRRVAREFKRRIGDPVPLVVGGTSLAAEVLMSRTLRWVVDRVSEAEGGPPTRIAVTHPANWGDYKRDLLSEALRAEELDDVELLSEPEAAAIHYAAREQLPEGATVAVYDLGGGTFDAAVLRRTTPDWEIVGRPEGIERLGGIDFDTALFQEVVTRAGLPLDGDDDDPLVQSSLHRLHRDCVAAKEQLSADTTTTVPVLLPGTRTEVHLTRSDLEEMLQPPLAETIGSLRIALQSARIAADDLDAVLLVGGSSRIPLVASMVSEELARPVLTDTHPKNSIALGAAAHVASTVEAGTSSVSTGPVSPWPTSGPATTVAPQPAPAITDPQPAPPATTVAPQPAPDRPPPPVSGPLPPGDHDRAWATRPAAIGIAVGLVVFLLGAAVLLTGRGGGGGTSGDRGDYVTALRGHEAVVGFADVGAASDEEIDCLAEAMVDAWGTDALQDAGTPDEVATEPDLPRLGLERDRPWAEATWAAAEPCFDGRGFFASSMAQSMGGGEYNLDNAAECIVQELSDEDIAEYFIEILAMRAGFIPDFEEVSPSCFL